VMQITRGASVPQSHGLSRWAGAAFMATGVAINLLSIRRHLRVVGELNRGDVVAERASYLAVTLAVFLALIGMAMALYVSFT
jgi:putative membrane protein